MGGKHLRLREQSWHGTRQLHEGEVVSGTKTGQERLEGRESVWFSG